MKYPSIVIQGNNKNKNIMKVNEGDIVPLGVGSIFVRTEGNLSRRSFYLGNMYDWAIVEDDKGCPCLIAIIKGVK